MEERFKNLRNLKTKFIYDQLNILSNEILNLISVAIFLNRPISKKKGEDFDKDYEYINSIVNVLEEAENIKENENFDILELDDYLLSLKEEIDSINKNIKTERKLEGKKEIEVITISLIHLYKKIKNLLNYLENFKENIEKEDVSLTEELIIFSFFNTKIGEFLKVLNLLSTALKFRKENAGQPYLPSPLLDRRYRLFNLQKAIKDQFLESIQEFLKENNKFFTIKDDITGTPINFILTSDYEIGDSVYKKSIDVALIRGSFFWREMGRNYPIMLHEILHKVVNFINEDIRNELAKLSEGLYTFLYRRAFFSDVGHLPINKDHLDTLTEDLTVDFLTFLILGDAYILALLLHGGLGFKYYDTLVKNEEHISFLLKKEKKASQTIDFSYIPTQINFQPPRDSTLVRIRFLFKIRSFLKEHLNDTEKLNNISVIDDDLEYAIKQYLNDLFPIFDESDLPKGVKDKFFYRTFSFMSQPQKATAEIIASIIKIISEEFFFYFSKKIENGDLKFFGKFWDIYFKKEDFEKRKEIDNKFYTFYIEDNKDFIFEIKVKANLNTKSNREIKEGVYIRKVNKRSDEKINIINFIWKMSIDLSKEKGLYYNVPEGRTLRAFSNTRKYPLLIKKLIKDNTITMNLDDLLFVKSRKVYDNNKKTIKENLKELFRGDKVKYLAMGPFDTIVLKTDIDKLETTKLSEFFIYKNVILNQAFLDRHAILKIEKKDSKVDKENNFWKAYILIKFSNTFYKYSLHKKLKKLKSNNKVKIDDFLNLLSKYFFSFSLGWEDVILEVEGNLEEIFKLKDELQKFKIAKFFIEEENKNEIIPFSLIDRTETIILYPLNRNFDNENFDDKKQYKMFVNIRVREEIEKGCKEKKQPHHLDLRKVSTYKFDVFLYPGIYDINLSKSKLSEKDIINIVNLILSKNPIFCLDSNKLDAEDVVIHLTKELEEKEEN